MFFYTERKKGYFKNSSLVLRENIVFLSNNLMEPLLLTVKFQKEQKAQSNFEYFLEHGLHHWNDGKGIE